jgi:predicted transcriptional regulator
MHTPHDHANDQTKSPSVAERRQRVVGLSQEGRSHKFIAGQLHISPALVAQDLARSPSREEQDRRGATRKLHALRIPRTTIAELVGVSERTVSRYLRPEEHHGDEPCTNKAGAELENVS